MTIKWTHRPARAGPGNLTPPPSAPAHGNLDENMLAAAPAPAASSAPAVSPTPAPTASALASPPVVENENQTDEESKRAEDDEEDDESTTSSTHENSTLNRTQIEQTTSNSSETAKDQQNIPEGEAEEAGAEPSDRVRRSPRITRPIQPLEINPEHKSYD